MCVNLVRVAIYDHPLKAKIARNCLEAEGIRAFVGNDQIAEMNWALTNAIGGIELRVDESQFEKSLLVLARLEDGADQLQASDDADFGEPDETEVDESAASDTKQMAAAQEGRERLERAATYAFRGAILGLLLVPLQLYVFWLLLKIFLANESLSPQARNRTLIAAVINLPMMLLVVPNMFTYGWLYISDVLR